MVPARLIPEEPDLRPTTHDAIPLHLAEPETATKPPRAVELPRMTDEAALEIIGEPKQQTAINEAVEEMIKKGFIRREDRHAAIAYANREAVGIVPNCTTGKYAQHLGTSLRPRLHVWREDLTEQWPRQEYLESESIEHYVVPAPNQDAGAGRTKSRTTIVRRKNGKNRKKTTVEDGHVTKLSVPESFAEVSFAEERTESSTGIETGTGWADPNDGLRETDRWDRRARLNVKWWRTEGRWWKRHGSGVEAARAKEESRALAIEEARAREEARTPARAELMSRIDELPVGERVIARLMLEACTVEVIAKRTSRSVADAERLVSIVRPKLCALAGVEEPVPVPVLPDPKPLRNQRRRRKRETPLPIGTVLHPGKPLPVTVYPMVADPDDRELKVVWW
jgi:hypothetical protein